MQKKGFLLIGLVLGLTLGWVLGFLRVPYIDKNASFGVGALGGVVFSALVALLTQQRKREHTPGTKPTVRPVLLWGILLSGLLLLGVGIYRYCGDLQNRIKQHKQALVALNASIQQNNSQNLAPLLRELLTTVEAELRTRPDRSLRDTTIARIAALSRAFKPYRYYEGDSLSALAWSPERGQLLKALVLLRINAGAFAQIKEKVAFKGADLTGVNFKGLDLSGIGLQEANLRDADLSDANLSGAHLECANCWGATLNGARLDSTDLKRADLRWAKLRGAVFNRVNMSSALLSNAQLTGASLNTVNMQWAMAEGIWLDEARLNEVNGTGVNFSKANLSRSKWRDSDWRKVNFKDADLSKTEADKVLVDDNWPAELDQWQVLGKSALQNGHLLASDTIDKAKKNIYRLKKKQ